MYFYTSYDGSYCWFYILNVFLTFYILQAGPPKHCGARSYLPPPLLSSIGLGVLIAC